MIKEFKGQYRFLSNFYPLEYPIRFNGFEFWTSEHLYVALKVTQDAGLQQIIASFETPGKAKKYGRNLNIRHDWEEIKFRCMRFALTQKFATNHELMHKLINTGDKTLIEGNLWHDNEWGKCCCLECADIHSQNRLGIMLMQVRYEFQELTGRLVKNGGSNT